MKMLTIRKPKFMRNDAAAVTYMSVAKSISEMLEDPQATVDVQYDALFKIGECVNKAARAAGFFNTKDFLSWIKKHGN